MKFLLSIIFLGFYACSTTESEKVEIVATFETYKESLLTNKYGQAAACLDLRTIAHYESLRQHVIQSDSATVVALPFFDEFLVLMVRSRTPKAKLSGLEGKTFFAYLLENELVDKKGLMGMELVNVQLEKNFAVGTLSNARIREKIVADSSSINSIPTFEFYKEEGRWKLNLTSLLKDLDAYANNSFIESGRTKAEVIIKSIEEETGEKPKFNF